MIGLIGKKIGMTQVFDESGVLTPVTVIHVEPNTVVSERVEEKNGYSSIVIGAVDKKKSRVSKPYAGQFPDGVAPKKYLVEIREFENEINSGENFGVEVFEGIRFVDIVGTTKGKGFQGVMKRHGFGGGRKTHGSKFHRVGGSTGQSSQPSRVMKGTKMAGRMGHERKTVQNLRVIRIDKEKQVLLVQGAVPGAKDGMVLIKKAKKKY